MREKVRFVYTCNLETQPTYRDRYTVNAIRQLPSYPENNISAAIQCLENGRGMKKITNKCHPPTPLFESLPPLSCAFPYLPATMIQPNLGKFEKLNPSEKICGSRGKLGIFIFPKNIWGKLTPPFRNIWRKHPSWMLENSETRDPCHCRSRWDQKK